MIDGITFPEKVERPGTQRREGGISLRHLLHYGRKNRECRGEGIVRQFGTDMYTLLYLKWITNKDLLYSTGNSAQYYVTT